MAATLGVAACAVTTPGRETLPAVAVPAAWTTAASSAMPTSPATGSQALAAQWWQRFGDATLTALVSRALESNTDVLGAQAALRQARALREQAAAGMLPAANASASAQRSKSGDAPASSSYQAGFDASWEPDIFGGTRATVAAADADAKASIATLASTRTSIAAETAVAYMQLRGFQARLVIARESLARQEETLQLTRWRAQAGLVTSLDVEQARAATEQTRAQIPALGTSIAQTEHSLDVLTGQPPGGLHAQLAQPAAVPVAPDDLALAIPADTLRQRPDVVSAEYGVLAAAARVAQSQAARYPNFRLSGSIGLSALALGSLTSSGAVVSALLGSVGVPVFDGGAARAAVDAQQAALERARAAYQAAVLAALRDVEDALVALGGTRERLLSLRQAADAAGNAALLADYQYQGGLIDFQTVLDTQRTLLSVRDSVASTEAELGGDYVRLYKALGGGWSPSGIEYGDAAASGAAPSGLSGGRPEDQSS